MRAFLRGLELRASERLKFYCHTAWSARPIFVHAAVLAAVLPAIVGCGAATEPNSIPFNVSRVDPSAPQLTTSVESNTERAASRNSFVHDFGVLKPGEIAEHSFAVQNDTAGVWTFDRAESTCRCTSSRQSARCIAPGMSESVIVTYEAAKKTTDEERAVLISFKEPSSPRIRLAVTAKVRAPLTTTPNEVSFSGVGRGHAATGQFEIHNYDDRDWETPEVRVADNWLSTKVVAVKRDVASPVPPGTPRQLWRVALTAATTGLASGTVRSSIDVAAKGGSSEFREVVLVNLDIVPPLSVIPGRLFFGRIVAGEQAVRKLTLRFSPELVPTRIDDVIIEHNLSDGFAAELRVVRNTIWELTARWRPAQDAAEREFDGRVTLRFPKSALQDVSIPIQSLVVESSAAVPAQDKSAGSEDGNR